MRFFILLGLALLIGISGGILLAMLLKQWKAEDAARAGASRGDRDDRKRDDA